MYIETDYIESGTMLACRVKEMLKMCLVSQ